MSDTPTTGVRIDHEPAGSVRVGSVAPSFELRDQNNQRVSLDDVRRDRQVLLVFFPLAFTGTCQGELGYIRDHLPTFSNEDVQILAISVGPPPTHKVWSAAQGFLFPILSDFWPHGDVARAYGVFNEKSGYANRGTFLVDRDGTVVFADIVGPGESRDETLWDQALLSVGS